jgi:hypothetical protein
MTAVGLGRPAIVTPIDGFLRVRDLTSALVAEDVSGPALAKPCSTVSLRSTLGAAAERDRTTIASSPTGWTWPRPPLRRTTNLRPGRNGRS